MLDMLARQQHHLREAVGSIPGDVQIGLGLCVAIAFVASFGREWLSTTYLPEILWVALFFVILALLWGLGPLLYSIR